MGEEGKQDRDHRAHSACDAGDKIPVSVIGIGQHLGAVGGVIIPGAEADEHGEKGIEGRDPITENAQHRRLSNTIRTRLLRRLMRSAFLSFIDGRQPICFIQDPLNASSILRRSKISEPRGRSETRHRFADGLSPFKKR